MSLDVDVAFDNVRGPLSRDTVASIARSVLRYERIRHALVSVTFVDTTTVARLNRTHLKHAGPTDVISFGFTRATAADPVIGDIYICPSVARDHARARRASVRAEVARLVIHGVLHVLGYDHPGDETRETSAMWRRQERLLRRIVTTAQVGAARR
jgi:probable rRNA maturation factor